MINVLGSARRSYNHKIFETSLTSFFLLLLFSFLLTGFTGMIFGTYIFHIIFVFVFILIILGIYLRL
jgi:hypothetical protein